MPLLWSIPGTTGVPPCHSSCLSASWHWSYGVLASYGASDSGIYGHSSWCCYAGSDLHYDRKLLWSQCPDPLNPQFLYSHSEGPLAE